MDEDKISVISIEFQPYNENQRENKEGKQNVQKDNKTSPWNICHVLSVVVLCVLFLMTITIIPRTNSIYYQSNWYEFNFCILCLILLETARNALNMATYSKEKSLLSIWVMIKLYSMLVVIWAVPYLVAYLVWCQYLDFNWPIPFLGYNYILLNVLRPAALWISIPRDLFEKDNFPRNFKLYSFYLGIALAFGVLREGMSIFLKVVPGYLQWIIAFLIPLLKNFEFFVLSRYVGKMDGGQEEESHVCLAMSVDSAYSFFIAVRLPNVETVTVCCILVVDFFLLLRMTYKIVRLHSTVTDETMDKENREKQRLVTDLALAELTEGMTPIVYAIGISMAYYGYNGNILGNVKNDYWGYKAVDDMGYLFQIMILLFGVDVLSSLINSFVLSSFTNVSLFQEFCRIMKKYWHFFAVKFATNMYMMFATKDINLGMDSTGEFNWITNHGRIELINSSTELSPEEKTLLFKLK